MKKIIPTLVLLCFTLVMQAQTIWNTGSFSFSKPQSATNQDAITPQTSFARVNVLYNSICQTNPGGPGCSYTGPCNTTWAAGSIANWNTLIYEPLFVVNGCAPPFFLNTPVVVHLISEDIYFQLTFTTWGTGTNGALAYTRTTGPGTPLPVGLNKFSVLHDKGINTINWTTYSEENNKGFEVERSIDGISFTKLTFVNASALQKAYNDYKYQDQFTYDGTVYYRLRQFDFDGNFTYSNIISVRSKASKGLTLSPNPAKEYVELQFPYSEDQVRVNIMTISGQQVFSQFYNDFSQSFRIPTEHLVEGVYFLEVLTNDRKETLRFVK